MSRLFLLPNEEEMLKRLTEANSNPHYIKGLYPLLLRYAGKSRVPSAIASMFVMAVGQYHDASDASPTSIPNAAMRTVLAMQDVPTLIDGLVDNKELAEAAKAQWQNELRV